MTAASAFCYNTRTHARDIYCGKTLLRNICFYYGNFSNGNFSLAKPLAYEIVKIAGIGIFYWRMKCDYYNSN